MIKAETAPDYLKRPFDQTDISNVGQVSVGLCARVFAPNPLRSDSLFGHPRSHYQQEAEPYKDKETTRAHHKRDGIPRLGAQSSTPGIIHFPHSGLAWTYTFN